MWVTRVELKEQEKKFRWPGRQFNWDSPFATPHMKT